MEISNGQLLMSNFILLSILDFNNNNTHDFVGTDNTYKNLVYYKYLFESNSYQKKVLEEGSLTDIQTVVGADFLGNKSNTLLVVSRDDDAYKNDIFFSDKKLLIPLPNSKVPPILSAHRSESKATVLIYTLEGKIVEYEVTADRQLRENDVTGILNAGEKLENNHSGMLVDLTGNLKADLVLKIKKNDGSTYLRILDINKDGYSQKFEIKVEEDTGSFYFYPMKESGLNDVIYISKESGVYYLNILYNNNKRQITHQTNFINDFGIISNNNEIYTEKNSLKINLSGIFKNCTPVFTTTAKSVINGGMSFCDLNCNGFKNIFIVLKDEDDQQFTGCLAYNESSNSYVEYPEFTQVKSKKNVISISFADYRLKGRECIFLNIYENSVPVLYVFENDLNKENYSLHVRALNYAPETKYGIGIPGVTTVLVYGEDDKVAISTQYLQSSLVYPQHSVSVFGIGSEVFQIKMLVIKATNFENKEKVYVISAFIIPNMYLIIHLKKHGNYQIESYFNMTRNNIKVIIVAIVVILINLLLYGIFYIMDKKKEKALKKKDRMHPLFRAL